jgi:predicted GNAT family N-acyltransferase
MNQPLFTVRPVNWKAQSDQLHAIRRAVFIDEQNVPEELEWDDVDASCYHVIAFAGDGGAIGTGRLSLDGRIGRMAVLKEWRGKGVGSAILKYLLMLAQKEGHPRVRLHAQTHAVPFYARHGFAANGAEFVEAGIPHRAMSIELEALPTRRRRGS